METHKADMSSKIGEPSASSVTQTLPSETDFSDDNTAASTSPRSTDVASTSSTPTTSSYSASTCASPTFDVSKPSPELSVCDDTGTVSTSLPGADVVSCSITPSAPSSSASTCTPFTDEACSTSKELTVHDDAQVRLTKPASTSNDTGTVITLPSSRSKDGLANDKNIKNTDREIHEPQNDKAIATAQLAEKGLHVFDSDSDEELSDGDSEQRSDIYSDGSGCDIPTSSIKEVKPITTEHLVEDGLQFFDSDSDVTTSDDDGNGEEDSEPDSDVGTDVSTKCELPSFDLPKVSSLKRINDPIRRTVTYSGQSFAIYGVAGEEKLALINDNLAYDDEVIFSNRPGLPEGDSGPRRHYIRYNGRESLYTIHEETEIDITSVSDRETRDTSPNVNNDSDSDGEDLDNERIPCSEAHSNVTEVAGQDTYPSSISFTGLTTDYCFRYQGRHIITARRCGLNIDKGGNSSKSSNLAFDRDGSIARPSVLDICFSNKDTINQGIHGSRSSNQDPAPETGSASLNTTQGNKRDRYSLDNDEPVPGTSTDTTLRCKRYRTCSPISRDPDLLRQSDPRPINNVPMAGTSTGFRIQGPNIAANVATNQSFATRAVDIAMLDGTPIGLGTPGPNGLSIAGHHRVSTETQSINNVLIPGSSSGTLIRTARQGVQQGPGRNPTLNERKRKRRTESCPYDGEALLKMIKREMDGQDN